MKSAAEDLQERDIFVFSPEFPSGTHLDLVTEGFAVTPDLTATFAGPITIGNPRLWLAVYSKPNSPNGTEPLDFYYLNTEKPLSVAELNSAIQKMTKDAVTALLYLELPGAQHNDVQSKEAGSTPESLLIKLAGSTPEEIRDREEGLGWRNPESYGFSVSRQYL